MELANREKVKRLFHDALELSSNERAALLSNACNGDDQVRRDVESLLSAHDRAGDFIVQPALVEAGFVAGSDEKTVPASESSFIGHRVAHYEIVRELGRGGMGAVFLAERADAQFEKQVAIKIVKRGMDTDAIIRRFVMERQILANLEHPNIARFLDGGTTDHSLPYFVMEYVEGEPITKYSDSKRLSTIERLQLFQQVCAAVQYAHQNLVVHRDIKPSNILVSSDGTPKLLDFGIAKLVTADRGNGATDQTATSLHLMTPEYASPEQLRGLPITTASDVYSLGVVLYELLTRHRPFRFDSNWPDEMVRVLLTEQPLRPSEVSTRPRAATTARPDGQTDLRSTIRNPKSLRGDLDNIVLKALHKERERRYASVQELSEDIRRHLAGLPVSARPDTFRYRAGKFVQRHRASVILAAIVILTLFSATIVTSWQAHVARRERAKAELRFSEERKLANSLITEVQTSLKEVPYSIPTQRLLAQKSLEYLNKMADDAGDNPEFLGELAAAYKNLGYMQAWTLQDNPSAVLSYQKAIDLCRRRLALQPDSLPAKRALGETLQNKIESLNLMERLEEASGPCVEKLSIEQELVNADPQNPDQLMGAAETSGEYGEVLRGLKQDDEGKTKFQDAVDLATRAIGLLRAQATTPQQRVDLSLMEQKQASFYEQLNELQQAAQSYQEAAAIASAVHVEHPEIVQALRNTTSSHWYLGQVMDRLGDHRGALKHFRVSLKTIRDAAAADPSVDPAHYGEEKYSIVVGKALCKVGNKGEGVPLIRHGVEITLSYARSDKGNAENSFYGPELLSWASEGLSYAGLTDEATTVCLEAITLVEQAAQNSPQDPNPNLRLVQLYELLGNVEAGYDTETRKITTSARARLLEARQSYRKALDVLLETVEKFEVPAISSEDQMNTLKSKLARCDALLGPFVTAALGQEAKAVVATVQKRQQ